MANILQFIIYRISATSPVIFIFAFRWYQQYKTWQVPVINSIIAVIFFFLFIFYHETRGPGYCHQT
jgi:multisubunit Na+/H+ antiporter MnhB subunit